MAQKKPMIESAAPAADKKKALETCLAQLDKTYGKGTVMRLGENAGVVVDSIPTGSLSLDIALGIGGVPKGRSGPQLRPGVGCGYRLHVNLPARYR